jgi:hypothetical protein
MPVEDHFRNMLMAMVANMSAKAPNPVATPKKTLMRKKSDQKVRVMTGCTDREEFISI